MVALHLMDIENGIKYKASSATLRLGQTLLLLPKTLRQKKKHYIDTHTIRLPWFA